MGLITDDQKRQLRDAYADFNRQATPEQKQQLDGLLEAVAVRYHHPAGSAGRSHPAGLERLRIPTEMEVDGAAPPAAAGTPGIPGTHIPNEPMDPMAAALEFPEVMFLWEALQDDTRPGDAARLAPPARERSHRPPPSETPVAPDGALLGTGRYQILDPGWVEAGIDWLSHIFRRAKFRRDPRRLRIPNRTTVAMVGDWGTGFSGPLSGAAKVRAQVVKRAPDYTIHLGDIYYSGRRSEVAKHFLALWPVGREGTFALNANHEMYSGGFGYFEDLLGHEHFAAQGGTSYFALENDHWVIVGLDSAYHANRFQLYRIGDIDDGQVKFLRQMAREAGNRRLMVLSHHQGLNLDGTVCDPLWSKVHGALEGRGAIWYWGHVHSGVVFLPRDGILGRCCGYGGMPRGKASLLENNDKVLYFEERNARDPEVPLRVVNGFGFLTFDDGTLSETFYDENGEALWRGGA